MFCLERRRRWSDSYKGVPVSDDEEGDTVDKSVQNHVDTSKVREFLIATFHNQNRNTKTG